MIDTKRIKALAIAGLAILLTSCTVTPEIGMTMAEYRAECKKWTWDAPSQIDLSSGKTVLKCGDMDIQVFNRSGTLERISSQEQVIALIEDDRCKQFGLSKGSSSYMNCRLYLANLRAQREAIQAARRQQASQALMNYGLMLQSINQPQQVNIQANCTAHRMGSVTHYNCR